MKGSHSSGRKSSADRSAPAGGSKNNPFPGIRLHIVRADGGSQPPDGGPQSARAALAPDRLAAAPDLPRSMSEDQLLSASGTSMADPAAADPPGAESPSSPSSNPSAAARAAVLLPVSGAAGVIGRRKTMEDTHVRYDLVLSPAHVARCLDGGGEAGGAVPAPAAFPNEYCALYAVFDGHSGRTASEVAAESIAAAVVGAPAFAAGDYAEALRQALRAVDEAVIGTAAPRYREDKGVGGACAVVALLVGLDLYVANAGDCECLVARKYNSGELEPLILTELHNLARSPAERERVVSLGAKIVFGRIFGDLMVTRAVGDKEYKRPAHDVDIVTSDPHIGHLRLQPYRHTLVLLACDGLFERLGYAEVLEHLEKALRTGRSVQDACRRLAQAAVDRGSRDNVTCLALDLRWTEETDFRQLRAAVPLVPVRSDEPPPRSPSPDTVSSPDDSAETISLVHPSSDDIVLGT
jgi:serine/threonine protein phosphatase PrpC